jgi:putative ABC transport system substrate-binding protein
MMDRRHFLGTTGLSLLAAPLIGEAQQTGSVPRVGFLVMARNPGIEDAFPRGLRDRGYVEGRDMLIEWRSAEGRKDHLVPLAAELVQLGVNVLVAGGPEALAAAMKATSSIPIVVVGGVDPVAEGWAASLARPAGQVTGLTVTVPSLGLKRLQFAKEIMPGLSRLAVLRGVSPPAGPGGSSRAGAIDVAARHLGLQVHILVATGPDDVRRVLDDAVKQRLQGVLIEEVAWLFALRARIADLAAQKRLPTIGFFRPSAEAGYLMTYGVDLSDLLRRAAIYVDKILKGAKAGELPIEQPSKLDLVINLKTAKLLGLTIPPSVLQRADEVIR